MPTTSDEAVRKATGKEWKEWFTLLDRAGAEKLSHKEIVAVLTKDHDVGPWWRQMVTVEYERARGKRVKHQTATGFNVSASKTLAAPVAKVYKAWATPAARRAWLDESELSVRSSTANKVMRIAWKDGSSVEVRFVSKDKAKTQVTVDHMKLRSAAAAARTKTYWKGRLAALQTSLES